MFDTLLIRFRIKTSTSLYDKTSTSLYDKTSTLLYDKTSTLLYDKTSTSLYDKSSTSLYDKTSTLLYDKSSRTCYTHLALNHPPIGRSYSPVPLVPGNRKTVDPGWGLLSELLDCFKRDIGE